MLTESSKGQRFHLYEISRIGTSVEAESRLVVSRPGERALGSLFNGHRFYTRGNEGIFELENAGGCS